MKFCKFGDLGVLWCVGLTVDLRLKESVVLMRNRKVETAMRLKHRVADTPSEALKVWCVSSTEYNINVDGFDDETIPISVEATGVPQLRAFILRVPAEEKLKILKLYCWSHLESLIASMEMWGVQSTILRRLEAREVVAKPRKVCLPGFYRSRVTDEVSQSWPKK